MALKHNISDLKEKDLYSLILYSIYKLTGDPQYSTISELIYTLNKDSLLNLCSVFGGCTIKIPTIEELKIFSSALVIYEGIASGMTFNQAYAETGMDKKYKSDIGRAYKAIVEVISTYGR